MEQACHTNNSTSVVAARCAREFGEVKSELGTSTGEPGKAEGKFGKSSGEFWESEEESGKCTGEFFFFFFLNGI